jgi:glycosyltransferase involved in cell wall biosynthesis
LIRRQVATNRGERDDPWVSDRDQPFISVIIAAYSRRTFLLTAIRSVTSHRTSPTEPEIVVVKNFRDEEIDRTLDSEGVKSIDFGSTTYGATIARAVRESRGEVVAFLEDDDLFDETKLGRLEDVFRCDSRLVFYHNDYREIDERGKEIPPSSQRRSIDRRTANRTSEVFAGRARLASFDRMGDAVAQAHMSCIAVRRSLLVRVADYLEHVPVGVDFFLFFVGMACDGAIRIDPGKFTLYRRHPDNSSRALSFDPQKYGDLVGGSRSLIEATSAMLRNLGAESLLPLLEQEFSGHTLYLAVTAPAPTRRALAAAMFEMLRHPGSFHGVGRRALFLQSGFMLLIPGLAIRLLRPRTSL